MMAVSYLEVLQLAAPETLLAVAAMIVLAVDLLVMRQEPVRSRFIIGVALAGFACLGAVFWMFNAGEHGRLARGILVVDSLTQWVKAALLLLTVFTLVISMEAEFTDHVGEYLALILMATIGMMFLVSTEDLLMIFVSLELTSLSLYILAAFNKRSLKSAEAALKYFLFGGMAAAFTLFGLSLLFLLLRWRRGGVERSGAIRFALGYLLPMGAFLAWRVHTFGDWLPNTYYAKVGPPGQLVPEGADYVYGFLKTYAVAIPWLIVLLPLAWRRRRPRELYLFTLTAAYLGIVIYEGGDWMPLHRTISPILPILYVLLVQGLDHLRQGWRWLERDSGLQVDDSRGIDQLVQLRRHR